MIRSALLPALLLVSVACDRQLSDPGPAIVTPTAAIATARAGSSPTLTPAERDAIARSPRRGLWSDVDAVCEWACDLPVAVVAWNVEDASVPGVKVYLVNAAGVERIFAAGGRTGGQRTGAWVRAGTTFVLRRSDDGGELDRLVIAGEDC